MNNTPLLQLQIQQHTVKSWGLKLSRFLHNIICIKLWNTMYIFRYHWYLNRVQLCRVPALLYCYWEIRRNIGWTWTECAFLKLIIIAYCFWIIKQLFLLSFPVSSDLYKSLFMELELACSNFTWAWPKWHNQTRSMTALQAKSSSRQRQEIHTASSL